MSVHVSACQCNAIPCEIMKQTKDNCSSPNKQLSCSSASPVNTQAERGSERERERERETETETGKQSVTNHYIPKAIAPVCTIDPYCNDLFEQESLRLDS